jgi:hypothetical protein
MLDLKNYLHFFGNQTVVGGAIIILWLVLAKQIKKLFNRKVFSVLFVSLPAAIIFVRILFNNPFFISDDFAHLEFVSTNSYLGILQIVFSKPGIWVNHHIVFGFWFFKAIYDFFGTNIYPYVTVIFLLNLTSTLGLYFLSGEFIKDNFVRTLISFLFGFLYLSWISNIHELLGAVFVIFSFFTFIRWVRGKRPKYGVWSIVLYILAIFSKEIAFLVLPFLLIAFIYMRKGHIEKNDLKILTPFLSIFILYSLFFASTFLGYFGAASGYKMTFNLATAANSLSYYLKVVIPGINTYFPFAVIFLTAIYLVSVYFKKYWALIFLFGFIIHILPALFFADRVSSYYAYIPAVFLFLSFGIIADFVQKKMYDSKLGGLKGRLITAVILVVIGLCLFNVGEVLKYNLYLVVYPWPNLTRDQYLNLISEVKTFEDRNGKSAEFKLEEESKGLVLTHGADVVKPFLPKREAGLYSYSVDYVKTTLVLTKK